MSQVIFNNRNCYLFLFDSIIIVGIIIIIIIIVYH